MRILFHAASNMQNRTEKIVIRITFRFEASESRHICLCEYVFNLYGEPPDLNIFIPLGYNDTQTDSHVLSLVLNCKHHI